jgi:hypothetical protein
MFETIAANDLEYAEAERVMRRLLARHPLDVSVRVIGTMIICWCIRCGSKAPMPTSKRGARRHDLPTPRARA